MQHLDLPADRLTAYHDYLQSDHDYRIKVDVLTMEEKFVDTMDLLDGQVNFNTAEEGPNRTASITLSDPQGALDFGESYLYDPKGILWVNRLLRIRHFVDVPVWKLNVVKRNLIRNPSTETNATDWGGAYGTAGAGTRAVVASGSAISGGSVYRSTWTTAATGPTGASHTVYNDAQGAGTVVENDVVSGGIYVRPSTTRQIRVAFGFRDAANNTIRNDFGAYVSCPANQWTRITLLNRTAPALTDRVQVYAQYDGTAIAVGATLDTDAAMLVKGAILPPYFDGDTLDTTALRYGWTGARHASPSTLSTLVRETITVGSTVFVGLPTAVSRSGGEVSLELGDKSLIADHGVRPVTYKKGKRVDLTLKAILEECTGEKNFRIPVTTSVLSTSYTVGMGEDVLTPWRAFKKIAKAEMSWLAYYDGEGFATCGPSSAVTSSVAVKSMLALPSASASLNEFSNYARVTSHRKPANKKGKKKTKKGVTLIHDSVVALENAHILSEQSLERNDVPRTLPIIEINDDLKDLDATLTRAENLLTDDSGLSPNRAFEIIPLFHMEPFDKVDLPDGVGKQSLTTASIPLGTGGNMTIGSVKWVSKPLSIKKIKSKTTVQKKKGKGGKKK